VDGIEERITRIMTVPTPNVAFRGCSRS